MLVATINYSLSTVQSLIAAASFQAQHRTVETGPIYGDWITLPMIPLEVRHFDVPVENDVTYDFRVRSVSQYGVTSTWATEANYLVDYSFAVPNDIANLALVQGGATWSGRDVELIWDEPADLYRVARYQLNIYTTSPLTLTRTKYIEKGLLTSNYTYDENYEDNAGSPVGALTFRIWALTDQAEPSANYDELVVTHTAPAAIGNLAASAYRGGVLFTWDPNTDPAFSHFSLRVRVEDDAWSILVRSNKLHI